MTDDDDKVRSLLALISTDLGELQDLYNERKKHRTNKERRDWSHMMGQIMALKRAREYVVYLWGSND